MNKEEINSNIYKKIIDSSEILLRKESDKSVMAVDAFVWMDEIVKNEDLNQVSDIYIYEEGFGDTDLKLKSTVLHAITSVIGFAYENSNIAYLENMILSDDNKKSDIALDYLLKLGRYHSKFKGQVLDFVERNFNSFSKNKLSITAFYLSTLYHKETKVLDLFKAVLQFHNDRFPDDKTVIQQKSDEKTIVPQSSDSETNQPKPWWKIW